MMSHVEIPFSSVHRSHVIELHVHLDGCVRHETLWELAKKKGIKLPGKGTFEELRDALVIKNPIDLKYFLHPFLIFTPYVAGDLDAMERIAYEFCEDEAKNGVTYVEARYCPHFWLGTEDYHGKLKELGEIVAAVKRGFERGEDDFGVKARAILCALNGTGMIKDVLELCKKFKGEGVVGMDIAMNAYDKSETYVEVPLNPEEIAAYEEARKCGIHRTLHAGEAGGADMVQRAVEVYHTERVGHGYRVVESEEIYSSCKEKKIHFETCPWSSYLTGAVPLGTRKHPIVRFAEEGVNFSLNSDDTTLTGRTLRDDYALAASWGLTEAHAIRAVELHVHLDGSVRHETLWELAKKKNMKLPGNGTFEELHDALVIRNPINLIHFLQPFLIFTPYIAGDLEAIERIAYEFCEDEAKNGVAYVEARYCPHFWLGTKDFHGKLKELGEVVSAVNRGFERGENDFGVKAKTILSALNGTGTIKDVVELCKKFKGDGVVGMDIATNANDNPETYVEVPLNQEEIGAYEEARKSGIHRTLHAGEAGGAEMVQRALDVYHTERIGHGYRVFEDEAIYSSCREKRVHFETCPWSSYLTGTVPLGVRKHPIVRFAEDGVNFSLNSDDPTLTGRTLRDDYALAASWGLTEAHAIRANLNAAHSCFLPDNEKAQLIKKIYKELNISH